MSVNNDREAYSMLLNKSEDDIEPTIFSRTRAYTPSSFSFSKELTTEKTSQLVLKKDTESSGCNRIISYIGSFFSSSKKLTVEKSSQIELEKLEVQIEEVQCRAEKLDNFIKNKPQLAKMCRALMKKHPDHIAYIQREDVKLDLDDPIDLITKYKLDLIYKEHELSERIRFLQSHIDIWRVFEQEVMKMQDKAQKQMLLSLTDTQKIVTAEKK